MKKLLAVPMVAVVVMLTAAAGSQEATTPPASQATSCVPLKQVYSAKHWREARPARGRNVCESANAKKIRAWFHDYRTYRKVATFPGPGHGKPSPHDGRWWAIPWCTVAGESGGNFHEANGDGAYQIIPSTWAAHGGSQFASKASDATPLEQHIVARRAARAGEPWYGGCGYN